MLVGALRTKITNTSADASVVPVSKWRLLHFMAVVLVKECGGRRFGLRLVGGVRSWFSLREGASDIVPSSLEEVEANTGR